MRKSEWGREGAERKGESSTLSTEPDTGLGLKTLRSQPEPQLRVRGSTDGATQVPWDIILIFGFYIWSFQNVKRAQSDLKYHLIKSLYFTNEKTVPHNREIIGLKSPLSACNSQLSVIFTVSDLLYKGTQIPRNNFQVFMNWKPEISTYLFHCCLFYYSFKQLPNGGW